MKLSKKIEFKKILDRMESANKDLELVFKDLKTLTKNDIEFQFDSEEDGDEYLNGMLNRFENLKESIFEKMTIEL